MLLGIFSDQHFGLKKNCEEQLQNCEQIFDEFAKQMDSLGVTTVIYMGDFFHSRELISVNTQERARRTLEKFSKNFDAVYMLVGNHDIYYKSTNDINSVEQFNHIPNVTVYTQYQELLFGNKNFALCPWGSVPKATTLPIDAAFGHFEFSGAALVGAISNGPYTMEDITNEAPLVFSGHWHIRKEYTTKTGKVITVGCPMQQNWGDVGNTKGFYVLDTETMEYTFYENTFSPKYIPVRWSNIKKFDTSTINNNYIRIIVDADYNYEDIVKVLQTFSRDGAKTVEPEYQYQKELSNIQMTLGDVNILSHEEAINLYINDMEIEDAEKDMIRPIALSLFKECIE